MRYSQWRKRKSSQHFKFGLRFLSAHNSKAHFGNYQLRLTRFGTSIPVRNYRFISSCGLRDCAELSALKFDVIKRVIWAMFDSVRSVSWGFFSSAWVIFICSTGSRMFLLYFASRRCLCNCRRIKAAFPRNLRLTPDELSQHERETRLKRESRSPAFLHSSFKRPSPSIGISTQRKYFLGWKQQQLLVSICACVWHGASDMNLWLLMTFPRRPGGLFNWAIWMSF